MDNLSPSSLSDPAVAVPPAPVAPPTAESDAAFTRAADVLFGVLDRFEYGPDADYLGRVCEIDTLIHRLQIERRLADLSPHQRSTMAGKELTQWDRQRLTASTTEPERNGIFEGLARAQHMRVCAWTEYLLGVSPCPPLAAIPVASFPLPDPVPMNEELLLVLDVDGVLNAVGDGTEAIPDDPQGAKGVSVELVAELRRVVAKTGARLLIASQWRTDPHAMHYLWSRLGSELRERCVGYTPVLETKLDSGLYAAPIRGKEVQAFLDRHPQFKRFVVIDDEAHYGEMEPHVIRTRSLEGLTREVGDRVIARLLS